MAKRKKVRLARKGRDRLHGDDSLLLQSAESLGRAIDALQRQLEKATKRLYQPAPSQKRPTAQKTKKRKKTRR